DPLRRQRRLARRSALSRVRDRARARRDRGGADRARVARGASGFRGGLRGLYELPASAMTRRDNGRVMSGTIAGTGVGALSTSLDARWMMAYSAALGVDDPRYFDTLAAEGPVAHPLLSVCYEWPAVLALRAKAVKESWALLGVHSTHHVVIHRLPPLPVGLPTAPRITVFRRTRPAPP